MVLFNLNSYKQNKIPTYSFKVCFFINVEFFVLTLLMSNFILTGIIPDYCFPVSIKALMFSVNTMKINRMREENKLQWRLYCFSQSLSSFF